MIACTNLATTILTILAINIIKAKNTMKKFELLKLISVLLMISSVAAAHSTLKEYNMIDAVLHNLSSADHALFILPLFGLLCLLLYFWPALKKKSLK